VNIDIRGKWALVTGSSRGIGREIARGLAAKGCNVVLHGRLPEHNASLAGELGRAVKVVVVAAELSVESEVDRLIREARDASGGIDVLYNNAAIMTPFRQDYATVTSDDYRRSFEVNVIAPIRITHGLLPRMLERRFRPHHPGHLRHPRPARAHGLRRKQGRAGQVRTRHRHSPARHRRHHESARSRLAAHRSRRPACPQRRRIRHARRFDGRPWWKTTCKGRGSAPKIRLDPYRFGNSSPMRSVKVAKERSSAFWL